MIPKKAEDAILECVEHLEMTILFVLSLEGDDGAKLSFLSYESGIPELIVQGILQTLHDKSQIDNNKKDSPIWHITTQGELRLNLKREDVLKY